MKTPKLVERGLGLMMKGPAATLKARDGDPHHQVYAAKSIQ